MSSLSPSGSRRSVLVSVALVAALMLVFAFNLSAMAQTTAFDSIPNPVPQNVASLGYQATSTFEWGDSIQLAPGTDRTLASFTVLMSSWACETGSGTSCSTAPGATFAHDITLNIYPAPTSLGDLHVGNYPNPPLFTVTKNFAIPFRPSADPTCATNTAWRSPVDNTCYNGMATPITFAGLAGSNFTLPESFVYTIAYNTGTYGASPLGVTGPYDSLNVGTFEGTPAIGVDVEPDATYWHSSHAAFYTDGGSPDPNTLRRDTGWTNTNPAVEITTVTVAPCTTDCYVDDSGNDAWFGTPEFPKATIQGGVAAVQPGGTVHVADGAYTGWVNVNKSLTLRAESHSAVLDGAVMIFSGVNDVTIDGFTVLNGLTPYPDSHAAIFITGGAAPNSHNIVVTNNILTGPGQAVVPSNAVEVGYAITDLEVSHNVIEKWRYGVYHNPSVPSGSEIFMNTFRDVFTGIPLDGVGDVVVRNNLFELPIGFAAIGTWQWNTVVQPGVNIYENSFPQGVIGVTRRNQLALGAGPNHVSAVQNWWGSPAGPGAPNATILVGANDTNGDGGVVLSSPWLPSGTNMVALGEPGFIPDMGIFIDDHSGVSGTTLNIPVRIHNPPAITGGTVDFTYDPAQLQILSVTRGAGLPVGFNFATNLTYPSAPSNKVRIAFSSTNQETLNPSAELAVVQVKLLGAPGVVTPLDIVTSLLDLETAPNDIVSVPVYHSDGEVTITGFSISGKVLDWGPTTLGVENVHLGLAATTPSLTPSLSDQSDAIGDYVIAGIAPANYTLTPSHAYNVCLPAPAACEIDGNDAALALSHYTSIALITAPNGLIAADVNGDGAITTVDVTLILRRAVGLLTTYPNNVPLWKFVPASRSFSFTLVSVNAVAQDFTAILMGDVDGGWDENSVISADVSGDASVVFLPAVTEVDGTVSIAVLVNPGSDGLATSVDLALTYDAGSFAAIEPVTAYGWMSAANLETAGVMRISAVTAQGVSAGASVVTLRLQPTAGASAASVAPAWIKVNGTPATVAPVPMLNVFQIMLPFLQSNQ